MIVDAHVHIIPRELTREAAPAETWRPRVFRRDGRQIIDAGGREIAAAVEEIVHVEVVLATCAARGIDHVLLCPWVNLLRTEADAADGTRTCRLLTDALAGIAGRYPDRVAVLGAVPLQDPASAARELESLMRLPGVHGVEVPSSVRGVYLGDERFRSFWEAAEGTGALVFIHPTTRGFDHPVFGEAYLWNSVGNPMETTIAAAQLVMGGVLEAHPRLRVLLAHGGGALPGLRGRLRRAHAAVPAARARLRESPDASLRRFYYDTVTHDADLLRALVAYAGPEHVLLGSDYPFDMGVEDPVGLVTAAALGPAAEAQVLGGTAAALLGLASRSRT